MRSAASNQFPIIKKMLSYRFLAYPTMVARYLLRKKAKACLKKAKPGEEEPNC